jgi:hypothetical protein
MAGRKRNWSGAGSGADTTVVELQDIDDLNRFTIQTLTGSVRVLGSIDGTTFPQQLVLSMEPLIAGDSVTEPEGTFVAVTTAGRFAYFFGEYKKIRITQVGGTGASVKVFGTEL